MSFTPFASRKRALGAAATLSLAVATVGVALAPYASAAGATNTATLSQSSGPQLGGNSITVTTTATTFNTVLSGGGAYTQNYIEFQWAKDSKATCSAKYSAAAAVSATAGVVVLDQSSKANLNVLTAKKAVIKIPAVNVAAGPAYTLGLVPAGSSLPTTSQTWLICAYTAADTTNGTLITGATYTIAPAPTVNTQVAATPGVKPTSGPALGGNTITITGTNLGGATVKLGALSLTPTINSAGTQITATVPPQAAGPAQDIVVSTTGGSVTVAGIYTYTNGITVSPNTTPTATAATDLDISGVGFNKLTFNVTNGTAPDSTDAHVYIVAGTYDPTSNGGVKTLGEAGECVSVLVISDTELICTLNTLKSFNNHNYNGNPDGPLANGTYTITVVGNGAVDVQPGGAAAAASYSSSIVSSGSTFTVAPY